MKDLIEAAVSGEVEAVVVFRRGCRVRIERDYARVYTEDEVGGPAWTDYTSAEALREALNA